MLLLFATFVLRAVGGDFSRLPHFQSELGISPLSFSFGVVGGYFSPRPHSFGEGWQSKEQFPALALLP